MAAKRGVGGLRMVIETKEEAMEVLEASKRVLAGVLRRPAGQYGNGVPVPPKHPGAADAAISGRLVSHLAPFGGPARLPRNSRHATQYWYECRSFS